MPFYQRLCTIFLLLCLTACLKVTGEAKDQFDLEEEESKLDFGGINVFPRNTDEAQSEEIPSGSSGGTSDVTEEIVDKPAVTEERIDTPSSPSATDGSVADEQEFSNFLKWKKERDSNSAEYQEFQEYQEYLLWLEFQKTKNK